MRLGTSPEVWGDVRDADPDVWGDADGSGPEMWGSGSRLPVLTARRLLMPAVERGGGRTGSGAAAGTPGFIPAGGGRGTAQPAPAGAGAIGHQLTCPRLMFEPTAPGSGGCCSARVGRGWQGDGPSP